MTLKTGNIIKNYKNEETKYSQPTTDCINNRPEISSAALRVLLHLDSAKEGTYTTVDSIMANTKLSRMKAIKAIKELEDVHLLKRVKKLNKGRYEYIYIIFDIPYENDWEYENGEKYLLSPNTQQRKEDNHMIV